LHVLPIHLPPLRERDNDVIEIARSFLNQYADEEGKKFQRLDAETELVLSSYEWPGNVRQLQNVVRNIVVLHDGESVTADMLPAPLDSYSQPTTHTKASQPVAESISPIIKTPASVASEVAPLPATGQLQNLIRPIALLEREAIEEAIHLCDGNIPTAAHYLQISAATIYRKRSSWQKHD